MNVSPNQRYSLSLRPSHWLKLPVCAAAFGCLKRELSDPTLVKSMPLVHPSPPILKWKEKTKRSGMKFSILYTAWDFTESYLNANTVIGVTLWKCLYWGGWRTLWFGYELPWPLPLGRSVEYLLGSVFTGEKSDTTRLLSHLLLQKSAPACGLHHEHKSSAPNMVWVAHSFIPQRVSATLLPY